MNDLISIIQNFYNNIIKGCPVAILKLLLFPNDNHPLFLLQIVKQVSFYLILMYLNWNSDNYIVSELLKWLAHNESFLSIKMASQKLTV